MKIEVTRSTCVGAGQCVLVADDLFDQDDDGLVVLIEEDPGEDRVESARLAASLCPARAIQVRE
ncbi:ferredoxin [Kribbella catacumbae]|uniref:ferredoxin n=1 Tax=Kribbella catacumbae TaxID=460086 RepID=UPI0003817B02|nr:ferredoxin [Kribbella catacumbae]